jgi:hypothetical protein
MCADSNCRAYPDESVYSNAGLPSCIYDSVVEALLVTCTVETDVAAIELVADVLEVFLELGRALAYRNILVGRRWSTRRSNSQAVTS